MESIDQISIHFQPDQLALLNICLAFLMFGVALDLKLSHFVALSRSPRRPLLGLISQWVLLPLLTLLLVFLFRPAASIALGMLLVACCPGGNVSNYAVHLSGSNTALSVTMTTVSTLAAAVVTPLYFQELSTVLPETRALAQSIHVPGYDMIRTIVLLIVLPLMAGMFLHSQWPGITEKIRFPVKVLSMTIFIGFVVVAIYSNYENLVNYLHLVFFLVLVHNALALLTGYHFARITGLTVRDARTISIETGIQNSGLGLILIFNFFQGLGGMALIAAWWGVWHLISAFTLAMLWSYRKVPVMLVPEKSVERK